MEGASSQQSDYLTTSKAVSPQESDYLTASKAVSPQQSDYLTTSKAVSPQESEYLTSDSPYLQVISDSGPVTQAPVYLQPLPDPEISYDYIPADHISQTRPLPQLPGQQHSPPSGQSPATQTGNFQSQLPGHPQAPPAGYRQGYGSSQQAAQQKTEYTRLQRPGASQPPLQQPQVGYPVIAGQVPPQALPSQQLTVQNVVIQQQQPKRIWENYNSRQSRILGYIQITFSFLSIICNVVGIVYQELRETVHANVSIYISSGIWCPLFFFMCAALAIAAAKQRTSCSIIANMVVSIVTVLLFGFSSVIINAVALGVERETVTYDINSGDYVPRPRDTAHKVSLVTSILLLIFSVVLIVCAIWSSVLCCATICCGRNFEPAAGTVQYIHNPAASQTMVAVSQPYQCAVPPYQLATQSYQPTTQPYQPAAQPYQPATQPYQPTAHPFQPATQPYQPTAQPFQPATQPYQPTTQPFQPAAGRTCPPKL